MTTLERTVVDVLDRPDLAGGFDEVWRSLLSVPALDPGPLEEYVALLGSRTLAAKVGFFLETRREDLVVPARLLDRLRAMIPASPVFMDRRRKGRLVARWALIVPPDVLSDDQGGPGMITATEVAQVAAETGFRSEVVEKVLRLHGILDRLDHHETTRGTWLLKGGTALNLLHLDVPRLSVDIDVNYVGSEEVEGMRQARPEFERALTACCEREGCAVRRAPTEHAGGKFRLRYPSVLGGSQNLEVDVSYVARVPLWGVVRSVARFPPASVLEVPTLTIDELAAGKFTALVQRSEARDAFDAASLLALRPRSSPTAGVPARLRLLRRCITGRCP